MMILGYDLRECKRIKCRLEPIVGTPKDYQWRKERIAIEVIIKRFTEQIKAMEPSPPEFSQTVDKYFLELFDE